MIENGQFRWKYNSYAAALAAAQARPEWAGLNLPGPQGISLWQSFKNTHDDTKQRIFLDQFAATGNTDMLLNDFEVNRQYDLWQQYQSALDETQEQRDTIRDTYNQASNALDNQFKAISEAKKETIIIVAVALVAAAIIYYVWKK